MKPEYQSRTAEQAAAHVAEECTEVATAFCKAKRWGWKSYNPELPENERETNKEWFLREIENVKAAIAALEAFGHNFNGGD